MSFSTKKKELTTMLFAREERRKKEFEMLLSSFCALLREKVNKKMWMYVYSDIFNYSAEYPDNQCDLRDAIISIVHDYLDTLSFSELKNYKKRLDILSNICAYLNHYRGPHNIDDKLIMAYNSISDIRKKEMIALLSCKRYPESIISRVPLDIIKLM